MKCVEGSRRGGHYFLPGTIRKGFMEQVAVELVFEHIQIRGKKMAGQKKKKVEKCMVL